MIGFLIAIISGALMSIQGVFNTEVTKASSIWAANTFVQFSAFLVCLLAWVISDRTSLFTVAKVEPKYMLLGGVIGSFITFTVITAMSKLGPAKAVMFIVIAQLIVAYIIELLGIFGTEKQPFSVQKLIGMLIAIVGVVIFKWK